jgi:hypothetical protein
MKIFGKLGIDRIMNIYLRKTPHMMSLLYFTNLLSLISGECQPIEIITMTPIH